jgi:hypothetical protein
MFSGDDVTARNAAKESWDSTIVGYTRWVRCVARKFRIGAIALAEMRVKVVVNFSCPAKTWWCKQGIAARVYDDGVQKCSTILQCHCVQFSKSGQLRTPVCLAFADLCTAWELVSIEINPGWRFVRIAPSREKYEEMHQHEKGGTKVGRSLLCGCLQSLHAFPSRTCRARKGYVSQN